jgi:hypothetical protein
LFYVRSGVERHAETSEPARINHESSSKADEVAVAVLLATLLRGSMPSDSESVIDGLRMLRMNRGAHWRAT